MIEALFDSLAPVTGHPVVDFILAMLTIAVGFVLMGLRFVASNARGSVYRLVTRGPRHDQTRLSTTMDDLRWDGQPYDHQDNTENWTGRGLRQIPVPMLPQHEAEMRGFYLDLLGMVEMRPPDGADAADGFWAVCGTRQVYFGRPENPYQKRAEPPAFVYPGLDAVAIRLTDAGWNVRWDNERDYVRRLLLTDPAGNQIALIGA
ncbi:hypothetical protein [Yoonia sp. BS5-3]|uniref:VOC domain-containing protein n=1 Tax=Yoonia phaeophyticola TaxID=3137369 RepID=A0ABZ2VBS3_9RHOB